MSPSNLKVSDTFKRAAKDPKWFMTNILGCEPWAAQIKVFEAIRDNPEVAVKSCHGAGKSWLAAQAVLWFLCSHKPSLVITTAPTDRQVKGILWKEIRLAHKNSIYPIGGKLLTQELRLSEDWWAWGFTAPDYDPDRFQGFHESSILVVIDEASGVSPAIYEAIDSVLSSGNSKRLEIGNPTSSNCAFHQSFKTPGVKKFSIPAFKTPNFTKFGIQEEDIIGNEWKKKIGNKLLPQPKLVTPDWVAKRYKRWGPESALYQSRVLAKFPEQGEDNLIPLFLIEKAQQNSLKIKDEPIELGVDVARYGNNETVIVWRKGAIARIHKVIRSSDTMSIVGEVIRAARELNAFRAKIDEVGVGAGVLDRLREKNIPVMGINGSRPAKESDRFANLRAETYWHLRERFYEGDIDLDGDDELASQLSSLRYKVNSSGKILIESKEEMAKRGLPSPDKADALALAFAAPREKVILW